jgi:hypothetical protein
MKATLVLSALVLALAGCSIVDPNYTAAEGKALSPTAAKPGTGIIRSVGVLPGAARTPSASAGSSADPNAYRLYIEMDNDGFQTVDVNSANFLQGQRVEISPDGRVTGF